MDLTNYFSAVKDTNAEGVCIIGQPIKMARLDNCRNK